MPTLRFNSSTGSDTTASGSAGSITASGTNASFSGSVVTLDGSPNLSGFNAAADILWMNTSTGRRFFDLSSVDNTAKTVTCVNAPAGTSTGRTWGIGSKRATFTDTGSRSAFTDAKTGWIIETETDQAIGSVITVGVAAQVLVIRSAGGTMRTLSKSANNGHFNHNTAGICIYLDFKFTNSAGSPWDDAIALRKISGGNTGVILARRCIFGDGTNPIGYGIACLAAGGIAALEVECTDCDFTNCQIAAIATSSGNGPSSFKIGYCTFRDNEGAFDLQHSSDACSLLKVLIDGGSWGYYSNGQRNIITQSTIHGSGDEGVWLAHATPIADIVDNQITGHTLHGLRVDGTSLDRFNEQYNNYGSGATANGSGAVTGITIDANSLQVDPGYVDAAGGNFAIGKATRRKAFPLPTRTLGINQSNTRTWDDIGVSQRREGSQDLIEVLP